MTKYLRRLLQAQLVNHVMWLLLGLVAIHQVLPMSQWDNMLALGWRLPFGVIVLMVLSAVVAYGLLNAWDYFTLNGEAKRASSTSPPGVLIQRIITARLRGALGVGKSTSKSNNLSNSQGMLPFTGLLVAGFSACIAAVSVAAPELFGFEFHSHLGWAAGLFLVGLCGLYFRTLRLSQNRADQRFGLEIIKLVVGREYHNWLKPLVLFLPAAVTLYLPLSKIVQMSVIHFVGLYLLAHVAGVLSRVPGGAGVFDGIFLIFAAKLYPAPQVFVCLIAYRVVYYCLPLMSGLVAWLLLDIRKNQASTRKTPWVLTQLPGQLFQPMVSAWLLGLAGSYWLGQVPHFLTGIIPSPPNFVAPYINNLMSVVFLIVWRCHWRRIDLSYGLVMGCFMLAATLFALNMLLVSSGFCLLMVWIFSSSRHYFYRTSALLQGLIPWSLWGRYCLGGFLLVSATVLLTQTNDIERLFVSQWLSSEALSPLEKLVFTTTFFAGILAVHGLFTRCDAALVLPNTDEMQRYNQLVKSQGDTQCHLGLAGDKYFLFSATGKSGLMFGKASNQWIVMGDPIGEADEFEALIWVLADLADTAGASVAFYKVDAIHLPLYINMGMSALKLGDEARVKLSDFNLSGSKKLNLRNNYNKSVKGGLEFSVLDGEALSVIMPQLQQLSDEWLDAKTTQEKQFSLGFFSADYLNYGAVAVVKWQGRVVAFANLWRDEGRTEVALDLMRYGYAAPKRVMEYLTLSTLMWAKTGGYHWFNLGLAPLAGLQSHRLACFLHKVGGNLFTTHSRFYNFAGVYTYKEKFSPEWHGRYLIVPHYWQFIFTVINIAKLISGGAKGLVSKG